MRPQGNAAFAKMVCKDEIKATFPAKEGGAAQKENGNLPFVANSRPFIHCRGNCQRSRPSSLHLLLRTPKTASIMSNTISDNLHRLIKSMSKPEKRYFKVFCSRHIIGDENNYEVLFDAIDKQETYDEEKLLRKFKGKGFTERFSIAKNRLYVAILKSLDAFHSSSSVEAQLQRQLHAVEILYNKSLYDQSLKLLNSARKVAGTSRDKLGRLLSCPVETAVNHAEASKRGCKKTEMPASNAGSV